MTESKKKTAKKEVVEKEDDVVKAELEGYEYKEAVKSEKKSKEPTTMKEKLEKKLGVKDVPDEEPEKEEKAETEKKENSGIAGAETKKETSAAEKVPTAHELAAKKQ